MLNVYPKLIQGPSNTEYRPELKLEVVIRFEQPGIADYRVVNIYYMRDGPFRGAAAAEKYREEESGARTIFGTLY